MHTIESTTDYEALSLATLSAFHSKSEHRSNFVIVQKRDASKGKASIAQWQSTGLVNQGS